MRRFSILTPVVRIERPVSRSRRSNSPKLQGQNWIRSLVHTWLVGWLLAWLVGLVIVQATWLEAPRSREMVPSRNTPFRPVELGISLFVWLGIRSLKGPLHAGQKKFQRPMLGENLPGFVCLFVCLVVCLVVLLLRVAGLISWFSSSRRVARRRPTPPLAICHRWFGLCGALARHHGARDQRRKTAISSPCASEYR